jgi:predicted nucleic acid-binding protein
MKVIVDASVAVQWFVEESYSASAKRLLLEGNELLAPDLIHSELGNVLWKKWRRGEVSEGEARTILNVFQQFPVQIYPSGSLSEAAWEFAYILERSFYDSLYLALAALHDCPLATADRRLYNALGSSSAAPALIWVEEIP